MEDKANFKALEDLLVDNPDLEKLESLLEQFNIFEALGAVKVELRHSDFLAFLVNPNQNHGLGDLFVKQLLQKVLSFASVDQIPVTPIDLDIWDLDEIVVLREWQNIDIMLQDERNQLVVVVENKIGSTEHSNQLMRYRQLVEQQYPGYRLLFLYLTPEGGEPSDPEYISIDYGLISELVEKLIETRASTLRPDVRTLISHYSQMLRRHIVSESEIANLCRKIYRKHQRALDLIYEYRPDKQEEIRQILESLISQEGALFELDHCSKSYIRFSPKAWQTPVLLQGKGWTRSGRILLFEFGNYTDRLSLNLIIGPGPEEIRQRLFAIAHENRPPLNRHSRR